MLIVVVLMHKREAFPIPGPRLQEHERLNDPLETGRVRRPDKPQKVVAASKSLPILVHVNAYDDPGKISCHDYRKAPLHQFVAVGFGPAFKLVAEVLGIDRMKYLDRTLGDIPVLGPRLPPTRRGNISRHGHDGRTVVDAGFVHVNPQNHDKTVLFAKNSAT